MSLKKESFVVPTNIKRAIDVIRLYQHLDADYSDIDQGLRRFLTDYSIDDYDGFSNDLDDNMDKLAGLIVDHKLKKADMNDILSYLEGFLEAKKIISSVYQLLYHKSDPVFRSGVFSEILSLYDSYKHEMG